MSRKNNHGNNKAPPASQSRQRGPSIKTLKSGSHKPSAATSWDPVAHWYGQWSGKEGSVYHKCIAIPTVLNLLNLYPHETLVDIGCGTGVLVSSLPPDVRYIGIDASPRLLNKANSNHRQIQGRKSETSVSFVQGDATRLSVSDQLRAGIADSAVFMLSIQDMKPLQNVLASTAWILNDTGRVVIFMLHPCFRVPRQSGWGWDEKRRLQYRRVDSYLSHLDVPVRPIKKGQPGSIRAFHRPLESYINGLIDNGFNIDQIMEVPVYPAIARKGKHAKAENRANSEIPLFLAIKASKTPRGITSG